MSPVAVDVLMITYNHERFIEEAVDSVLQQKVDFPLRLLISDDASTDSTPRLLRELAARDDRIDLTLREQNVGMHANIAGVWDRSTAPYIAILEGDDRWVGLHKLQTQVEAMEANPAWGLCFHPVRVVRDDDTTYETRWPGPLTRADLTEENLATGNFVPNCSVVYRRIPGFTYPSWLHGLPMGDWPIHILHGAGRGMGFIDEIWAEYRMHVDGAWTRLGWQEQKLAEVRTIDAVARHSREHGMSRHTVDLGRLRLLRQHALAFADAGYRRQAARLTLKAVVVRPFDRALLRFKADLTTDMLKRFRSEERSRRLRRIHGGAQGAVSDQD